MPKAVRISAWVAIAVAGVTTVLGSVYWDRMQADLDRPIQVRNAGIDFVIERGQNLRTIASALSQLNVLRHPNYWLLEAKRTGLSNRVQAGEYRLDPSLTPRSMLAKFVAGDVQRYAITFIEGYRFRDYRALLASSPKLTHLLVAVDNTTLMAMIGAEETEPEGLFFPDTYFYVRGTTDLSILQQAYQRMRQLLADEWSSKTPDLPYANAYQALVMASLIEKETGIAAERATIAGVFTRRLKLGMKLQTDPAVIYGIGESFDGNLRKSDLAADQPYNTYLKYGLPPTPIAMPGRDAIRAALQPDDSGYLYFVARGDGSHQFSTSLAEHNDAVALYQK